MQNNSSERERHTWPRIWHVKYDIAAKAWSGGDRWQMASLKFNKYTSPTIYPLSLSNESNHWACSCFLGRIL